MKKREQIEREKAHYIPPAILGNNVILFDLKSVAYLN